MVFLWFLMALQTPEDREFLEWIIDEYKDVIHSTARKMVQNYHDREDVVQECMAKIVKNVERFREIDSCALRGYLVILTKNTVKNFRKKQNVITKYFVFRAEMADIPEMTHTPEEIAIYHEHLGKLYIVWPELTEREQTILTEKYILGFSDADIAKDIGCKANSVRTLIGRARKHALEVLKRKGITHEE